MAQRINVVLNAIPSGCRDLVEFAFFCGVGFTFGSLGLIWLQLIILLLNQKWIITLLFIIFMLAIFGCSFDDMPI